jgi:hypothetical protein
MMSVQASNLSYLILFQVIMNITLGSALNFKVQSDSVILAIRDGCIADIYYCDLDFTRV